MSRPAPQRVARPYRLAAASALAAQVAAHPAIPADQRHRWVNTITQAFNQLIEGVHFEREPDGAFLFTSRSRSGVAHRVNGRCSCEAADEGAPCWHRAARRMVLWIKAGGIGEAPAPAPTSAPRSPLPFPPQAFMRGAYTTAMKPECSGASCILHPASFSYKGGQLAADPAPRRLPPVTPIRRLPARGVQAEADELFPERP